MTYLVVSLATPVLGAMLYRSLHGQERAMRLVDGFVYVAVPALVAIQVLPHAIEERSVLMLVMVAVGALVPTAFERASRFLAEHTDNLAIVVGISGLVVHVALEGAALVPAGAPIDPAFGWAVVLHRIPVGLIVWWLVRPRHGISMATAAVGSLVLATLVGAVVGIELTGPVHGPNFELFEAFVAGTLLHVVFHQGRHDHAHESHGEHGHPH
ncbi:MAG: hypothetical protein WD995_03505 [Gemmatimonadota bacterium]